MAQIQFPPDFKEFLRLLHVHGVEYLLIGGYAVGFHGYPRATADMDIWIAVHPDNAERVCKVVREFGMDVPDLVPELFLDPEKIVRMGVPPLRIEILSNISGVSFDKCYANKVEVQLDDIRVQVIDIEHLKQNKQAAGRNKDLADLDHL